VKATLITSKHGYEIWARWDKDAQVYELFFEQECESYTGSVADNLKDAESTARYILEEQMAEQAHWDQRSQYLLDDA
jgi:hypothetical protein